MKNCNKLVRLVCLLLAMLMAVTLFAGCKKDKKVESSATSSKDATSILATDQIEESQGKWDPNIPEEKDLGGIEITMAGHGWAILPEEGESADGDLIREAMFDIQKRYNCTFVHVDETDWFGVILPGLLSGASFTISNLGSFGIESFTPVINPPQTGILGVDTISTRVREVNGELKTYPAMGLSLTYDHRAIDGAPASRFLVEMKNALENFSILLRK